MYMFSIEDSNCTVSSDADVQKSTQTPFEYCLNIFHHLFIYLRLLVVPTTN